MQGHVDRPRTGSRNRSYPWIIACAVSALVLLSLWGGHESHIRRAIPYALLAACPLIHLVMHRGHGRH